MGASVADVYGDTMQVAVAHQLSLLREVHNQVILRVDELMKANITETTRKTMFHGKRYIVEASILLDLREQQVVDIHDLTRVVIIDEDYLHDIRLLGSEVEGKALQEIGPGSVDVFLTKPLRIEFSNSSSLNLFTSAFNEGCGRLKARIQLALEELDEAPVAEGEMSVDKSNQPASGINQPSDEHNSKWQKLIEAVTGSYQDNSEWQQLIEAITESNYQAVGTLFESGMEKIIRSSRGTSLMLLTLVKGDTHMSRYLLDLGAPVGEMAGGYMLLNAAVLFDADREAIKFLIAAGADVDAASGERGETALMDAAGADKGDRFVNLLLDHGADPHTRDNNGYTALASAIAGGNVPAVRALIRAGCDVNSLEGPRDDRITPLWMASMEEDTQAIAALLDAGAEIDLPMDKGDTSLCAATALSKPTSVRYLLKRGASTSATSRGMTALDIARSNAEDPNSGSDADEVLKLLS